MSNKKTQRIRVHPIINENNTRKMKFINNWYPVIIAFTALLYSVGLGLMGFKDDALYSAHWPGTILLFAIAIRQRRNTNQI
jgi:hypothetical protein